jgi:23S rRNA (pseudouridine1915-N3)-methyltransferase
MKITLILVGKTEGQFSKFVDDYVGRIQHYIGLTVKTIPDIKNTKSFSEKMLMEKEGALILKSISPQSEVILLDDKGYAPTSVELAAWFEKKMNAGNKELTLIIGGPYGFSENVKAKANQSLSLSKLTFSHQMVRIILLEQIYRAFTIIKGEPYHHA